MGQTLWKLKDQGEDPPSRKRTRRTGDVIIYIYRHLKRSAFPFWTISREKGITFSLFFMRRGTTLPWQRGTVLVLPSRDSALTSKGLSLLYQSGMFSSCQHCSALSRPQQHTTLVPVSLRLPCRQTTGSRFLDATECHHVNLSHLHFQLASKPRASVPRHP